MRIVSDLLSDISEIEKETNECFHAYYKFEENSAFYESQNMTNVLRDNNELTFRNSIDFLYMLYYERAGVNIKFISKYLQLAEIDKSVHERHYKIVHDIRTILSHHLSVERFGTMKKNQQMWFYVHIGHYEPINETHWQRCVIDILMEAKSFLLNTKLCLCSVIKQDDGYICENWRLYRMRFLSKHAIIEIASEIFRQYELDFEATSFVERNISQIQDYLGVTSFDAAQDAVSVAKRKIESMIFEGGFLPCPITFKEIVDAFSIQGKEAGEIKKRAVTLFRNNPYLSKPEIINLLKNDADE